MGASQDKKKRKEMKQAGADNRKEKQKQLELQKKKARTKNTIIGTVVAVILIAVLFVNSTFFYTGVTALTIGDRQYSIGDFNYYYYTAYRNTYNNLYKYYGSSVTLLLNPNIPFKDQMYDDTRSWDDYFEETALNNMRETAILCDAAKAAGLTLSQEDIDNINRTIDDVKSNYSSLGYSSLTAFFTGVYGKGVNEKNFRKNLENEYLATLYVQDMLDKMEFSDEELDSYYNEHRDEYDLLTYRRYYVSGSADEEKGIDSETAMAKAKETAEAIAKAKSEQEFIDLVYKYAPEENKETYADSETTLYKDMLPSSIFEEHAKWLLDDSRVEGDTTVIEASSGYYVIYYIGRNDNSYNTVNVRNILISVENSSEDADKAAKEKAEALLKVWQNGEATEDSFAELAKTNSADNNAAEGGLCKNVYKGQKGKEFEAWCFDESRKPGDTGIVKTESGYQIIYFSGKGEPYRLMIAKSALQNEEYANWLEAQKPNYEITKKFALKFAK